MIVTAFVEWKIIIPDIDWLTIVGKTVALACGRWVISRSLLTILRRLPWLKQSKILNDYLGHEYFLPLRVIIRTRLDMAFDANK